MINLHLQLTASHILFQQPIKLIFKLYINSFLLFHGFIFFESLRLEPARLIRLMAWRNFQSRLHEIKITNNQLEEHVSSFKPRVVLKRVGISDASRVGLPRLFCKRVRIFFVLPGLDLKLDNIMVKIVLDLYGKYSEEHRINDEHWTNNSESAIFFRTSQWRTAISGFLGSYCMIIP
uniref:Uncharacterized protein n=1 Tax=Cacopsylla melanoneura TaxID=428564 RepID=A0A8D8TY09_9HEMI